MLIGYMRVSSDSDRQSTDLQKDALLKLGIDERNLFSDHMSGAKDNRPGLTQMLEYIREGDTLVVWKLDRLGRSLVHLVKIVEDLKKRNIGFRSLTENIDTTTPQGELYFHLFSALAQYERSLARERIMAGLEAAKKRGKHPGRPRAVSEEKLQTIQKMLKEGSTKAHICRLFNIPRPTLNDTLKRVASEA